MMLKNTKFNDSEMARMASILIKYYHFHKKQKDIAQEMGISPGLVNTILSQAKKNGFVQNLISMPKENVLAAHVQELFSPDIPTPNAIVVPFSKNISERERLRGIGVAAARYFEAIARDGIHITLDGGETIFCMIEELRRAFSQIEVYSVAGGPQYDPYTSVNLLVNCLLVQFGATRMNPHILPGPRDKDLPIYKKKAQNTLKAASKADVFFLGVGALGRSLSRTNRKNMDDLGIDYKKLQDRGIVGISAYSAFDAEGEHVVCELDEKILKVAPEQIKKAARSRNRHVVILAYGLPKVKALRAMLKGGWGNCLITDSSTAEKLLDKNEHISKHFTPI